MIRNTNLIRKYEKMPNINIELNIENNTGQKIPAKKQIKQTILETLEDKNITSDVSIGIKIVSLSDIKKLNNKYRHLDKPTDVLSFPIYNHPPKKSDTSILLGDIVICPECLPAIRKSSSKSGKAGAEKDFLFLIKHATEHLLGYHHK